MAVTAAHDPGAWFGAHSSEFRLCDAECFFLRRMESERPGQGQKQILAVLLLSVINTSHISPMKALNSLSFLQNLSYVECLMFLKESEGRRSIRNRTLFVGLCFSPCVAHTVLCSGAEQCWVPTQWGLWGSGAASTVLYCSALCGCRVHNRHALEEESESSELGLVLR